MDRNRLSELLAIVATHVAEIWPLLGPPARSGSARSAIVGLWSVERLATLPRADDELGVIAV